MPKARIIPGVDAAKIMAENERLKNRILELEQSKSGNGGTLTIKLCEVGVNAQGVWDGKKERGMFHARIYGLQKAPYSFYGSQLIRLFSPEMVATVREFVEANVDELTWKGDPPDTFPWTAESNGRKKATP